MFYYFYSCMFFNKLKKNQQTYRNTEVNISRDLPISDCGPVNCANHVRLSTAARMPISNRTPQRQHLWASIKETF